MTPKMEVSNSFRSVASDFTSLAAPFFGGKEFSL